MLPSFPSRFPSCNGPGDKRLARVHSHLRQLEVVAITALGTAWFVSLGPVPVILALMVAKYVLVALLMTNSGEEIATRGEE